LRHNRFFFFLFFYSYLFSIDNNITNNRLVFLAIDIGEFTFLHESFFLWFLLQKQLNMHFTILN